MDGLDLTKEILLLKPSTRIVFISADEDVMQEALNAGTSTFLKKPVSIYRIMDDIKKAC
jgi:FixJ family two-component response regulator